MNDSDPGCLSIFLLSGFAIALGVGMVYISYHSYEKRKAHCKSQGGQWIEAFAWDESKCLEAAEKGIPE